MAVDIYPGRPARLSHTWAIAGEIKVPSGDTDYILPAFFSVPRGHRAVIAGMRYRINSGTSVTWSLFRNPYGGGDNNITSALTASTTTATNTTFISAPISTTLIDGDWLRPVVSAVAGTPRNLTVTVFIDYVRL